MLKKWKATHRIYSPIILYVIFFVHVSENAIDCLFHFPTSRSYRAEWWMLKSEICSAVIECTSDSNYYYFALMLCFGRGEKVIYTRRFTKTYMTDAWWIVYFSSLNFRHRFFKLNLYFICIIIIIIHANRWLFISLCIAVWRCGWLRCAWFDKVSTWNGIINRIKML